MLTKKIVNEQHGGCYTLDHTDSFGTLFQLSLFTCGNFVICKVARNGKLLYHTEKSYDNFRMAAKCFSNTRKQIVDEKSAPWLHDKFSDMKPNDYHTLKEEVQEWIVRNNRPMQREDAEKLAKSKDRDYFRALDNIYTAACAIANDSRYHDFAKRHNFSVRFSV